MELDPPKKLFQKATALGFQCQSTRGSHRIWSSDPSANWYLVYKLGHWTLAVDGIPQMTLSYMEVIKFLERRALANVG